MDIEKIIKINIETKRLVIRQFKKSDVNSAYLNWGADEEVSKYLDWDRYQTKEQLAKKIQEWIEQEEEKKLCYAIELKEINEVIGTFTINNISRKHKTCEVRI